MSRPILFALALTACGAPKDSRCSVENCAAMVNACQTFVTGMPNTLVCLIAGLKSPAGFADDQPQQCADACNAGGQGALLACVGERKSVCENAAQASGRAAVIGDCQRVVNVTPTCVKRCNDLGNACDRACPTDTWDHCFACVRNCGLNRAACQASCTSG